ncbi:esterase [Streptomyces albireticuli]|uniref:Esterase n=1 Tax=Streptomyces albireticuli TaxID=1940 RepID=A0A1Z2KUG5_9ACTN|nr:hypothetical protein [Streptomyces albireticuli]ARZ65694.1 esterase [Streptomyces albireticuli]
MGAAVEEVRRGAGYGTVVLVGASGGGTTVTGVGHAVSGLVSRIVYASAWCCVGLPSVADYLETLGIRGRATPGAASARRE